MAEVLLDRHGVVTRGAVVGEHVAGGYAAVYPVLRAMEESGHARRGYFVEGLGAAQFALPGAVDRLRSLTTDRVPDAPEQLPAGTSPADVANTGDRTLADAPAPGADGIDGGARGGIHGGIHGGTHGGIHGGIDAASGTSPWAVPVPESWRARAAKRASDGRSALLLAATDPANPYGAALPWPERSVEGGAPHHRPGRKAGALVVLVDGELVLYVERGGKSLLTFTDDRGWLQPAVDALALAVRDGVLGKVAVERADGDAVLSSALADVLRAAGFHATPRGLRIRT